MNDKTKLVKEAKNDKASHCCWSAYQKRIRKNGIRRNGIRRNATQPSNNCTLFCRMSAVIFSHSLGLVELRVAERMPSLLAALTWFLMRASSGEIINVGPSLAQHAAQFSIVHHVSKNKRNRSHHNFVEFPRPLTIFDTRTA